MVNLPAAHRATSILIAEDERIVAMDLSRRLEGLGYTVVGVVGRGDDAVRAAAKELPDIVLMDVHLGGALDGVEAARRILEQFGIPVVFATAYSDVDTLKLARGAHPFGYILKPFQDDAIQATIEIAVCRWNSEQEIKQREQLFLATMGAIKEAVIAVDDGLLVTFMNRASEEMTGWKLSDALTSPIWNVLDLYAPDGSDIEPGQLTDKSTAPRQLLLKRNDGSTLHVSVQRLLLEPPPNRPTMTVYVIFPVHSSF
jgi:CheY-like chemotaxis protein